MSMSREFPCVFSSLVVYVKQNSNEDVEVTVYRLHSQSYQEGGVENVQYATTIKKGGGSAHAIRSASSASMIAP